VTERPARLPDLAWDAERAGRFGERTVELWRDWLTRYVPRGLPNAIGRDPQLDALNERPMTEVQQDGRVFCSNAVLGERYVLRACIVNFRTEAEDLDAVLDVTAEIGSGLDAERRPPELRG
jgi:hypothetical protein